MALAPAAYVLWNEVLRYDPAQPGWPNRDRFVLSCGHASMLLYSVLHLAGVKQLDADGRPTDEPAVPLEAIRQFRQLDSRCPGHPEHGHTSGVETTTGPLGQGIGNSVGMAIASRWLAARLQPAGLRPVRFQRLRLLQRRRPDGGRRRRGGLAGRAPETLEPLLDLRRQPHHDRGQHVAELSARTWPRGSPATAGTWSSWTTSTIWPALRRADRRRSSETRDRPTLSRSAA